MSKELQALDNLTKGVYCPKGTELCTDCSICEKNTSIIIIKKALKDYENLKLKHQSMQDAVLEDFKKLKALEIIKEKFEFDERLNANLLNQKLPLTQEEYDLLKEELLNGR